MNERVDEVPEGRRVLDHFVHSRPVGEDVHDLFPELVNAIRHAQ